MSAVSTTVIITGGTANESTRGTYQSRPNVDQLGRMAPEDMTAKQAAANALTDAAVAASMKRLGVEDISGAAEYARLAHESEAAAAESALRAAQYEELTRAAVPSAMSAAESAIRAQQYADAVEHQKTVIDQEHAIRQAEYLELTAQAREDAARAEEAAAAAQYAAELAGAVPAVIDPATGLISTDLLPDYVTEGQVVTIVDEKTAIIDGGMP